FFFFFQAEDGIRDGRVTGVQTCALPICLLAADAACVSGAGAGGGMVDSRTDRKSTRLNSSHPSISYSVFCFKKKKISFLITSSSILCGDFMYKLFIQGAC